MARHCRNMSCIHRVSRRFFAQVCRPIFCPFLFQRISLVGWRSGRLHGTVAFNHSSFSCSYYGYFVIVGCGGQLLCVKCLFCDIATRSKCSNCVWIWGVFFKRCFGIFIKRNHHGKFSAFIYKTIFRNVFKINIKRIFLLGDFDNNKLYFI